MQEHETALTDGEMAELVSAGVKALILIANELGAELAGNWARNGEAMQRAFRSVLMPPRNKEEKQSTPPPPSTILRSISKGKKVTISACKGKRTIARSDVVFTEYLDSAFQNLGKRGKKTPATDTEVYEMVENATFAQMFTSLSRDLNCLVFTQDQIVTFVEQYSNWLRAGGTGTFFLFKENEEFFVAYVTVDVGGARVRLRARHLAR